MKLDLEALGQSAEIAIAACMGKIEEELPQAIGNDWWKKVIKDKLDEETSEERYAALMLFLVEEKECVERQMLCLNRAVESGSPKKVVKIMWLVLWIFSLHHLQEEQYSLQEILVTRNYGNPASHVPQMGQQNLVQLSIQKNLVEAGTVFQ